MKRLLAFCLCILLSLSAVGCGRAGMTVLNIGVEKTEGDLYPFGKSGGGDEIIKDVLYARLVSFDGGGNIFCGEQSSAVSESVRVYAADSSFCEVEESADGCYTAFEFSLKDGVVFSDGTEMTAQDVLFSLYCAIDGEISELDIQTLSIVGLYDYLHQSPDASELFELGYRLLEKGEGYAPVEEDGFGEAQQSIFWDSFYEAGNNFVSNIISYVNNTYCTDELIASYIFDGYTAESVKSSLALTNSYAMRLWNYGNYTYSYLPDENGIFVGVEDGSGGYTYKTTLEKALEGEEYTEFAESENGAFVYDRVSANYRPYEENDTGKRYDRVLSSKYVVLSRQALTGFRDTAGRFYTLEGEDYPTIEDFFTLMAITYTKDGIIDYRRLESIEAASVGDSFTKNAVEGFVSACAEGGGVDSVEGIRLTENGEKSIITVYVEGTSRESIYYFDIPIVCASYCTNGYTASADTAVSYGVPLGDYNLRHHIEALEPMSAGAYAFDGTEQDEKGIALVSNRRFNAVSEEYINSERYDVLRFVSLENGVGDEGLQTDIRLWGVSPESTDLQGGELFYVPDFSYDYILVNPSHYININTRRALLSVMDTSVATQGEVGKEIVCCLPSFMWAAESQQPSALYDESGESAKAYFEAAGYTYNENGELTDPITKQRAVFTLSLLPSAKDSPVCRTFEKAAQLLCSLGAEAKVVYDRDLIYNIYSENGVGIYSLGWETDESNSLYKRYAYSSGSDSVAANGIGFFVEGGQLDNFGTVTFSNEEGQLLEYNQSDAAKILDELILTGDRAVDFEEKKTAYGKALVLINELSFELPVYQRGSYTYVNSGTVDASTVNREPTAFASVISEIWKISPLKAE